MSKFIHYSMAYEARYLESRQGSLVEAKVGILNFDIRNDLPKTLNIDPLIPQLHFDSYGGKTSLTDSDLKFLVHGSDVVAMWERSPGFHRRANYYRFLYDATLMMEKVKAFVIENDIKEVWYNMVPHGFEEYLFATTVENLGGKVYYLAPAFFPWAQTMWTGLISKERVIEFDARLTDGHARKLILLNDLTETPAMQLQESQNNAFKLHRLLVLNPLAIVKRIPLFLWKRAYKKHSVQKPSKNSILIYLHYQPEATSLPFFGSLLAQFSVVRKLTDLKTHEVYIKEHPNQLMETPPIKARARWSSLYKDLNGSYGVEFLDMNFSLDDAIDNGVIVFSIAGSVVFEYLLKGGDVIIPEDSPLIARESFRKLGLQNIGNGLYRISPTNLDNLISIETKSSITFDDNNMQSTPEDRFKVMFECALVSI